MLKVNAQNLLSDREKNSENSDEELNDDLPRNLI
jgi:hypothetical protein